MLLVGACDFYSAFLRRRSSSIEAFSAKAFLGSPHAVSDCVLYVRQVVFNLWDVMCVVAVAAAAVVVVVVVVV